MAEREWWRVEYANGNRPLDAEREYPNREAAIAAARGFAKNGDDPLVVAKCTHQVVRRFQRVISVNEEAVPPTPPAPVVA